MVSLGGRNKAFWGFVFTNNDARKSFMSRIISALLLSAAIALSATAAPVKLADKAPESYIVVKGDTLWSIAGKFIQEPWRWPEIWRLNKSEIKNPHRIYPGNVVVLDFSDGSPRLRLGKQVSGKLLPSMEVEAIPREVPSIPAHLIEPFITRPLVIEENDLRDAPQVIGLDASRIVVGDGDEIFVLGIDEGGASEKWSIYRPGTPIKDPLNEKKILGYEARYLGTARLKTPGEVSILTITTAKEEILKGDLLVPTPEPDFTPYMPHEADMNLMGDLVSVYGSVSNSSVGSGGKDSVVLINLGAEDGLERGHVLSLHSRRSTVYTDNKTKKVERRELPEERYGIIFIFRVFDHLAYGLVMEAKHPLAVGDAVRNP
jgi:hypothetical protein